MQYTPALALGLDTTPYQEPDSHVSEPTPFAGPLLELDPVFGKRFGDGVHGLSREFDGSDEDEDLVGCMASGEGSGAEERDEVGASAATRRGNLITSSRWGIEQQN